MVFELKKSRKVFLFGLGIGIFVFILLFIFTQQIYVMVLFAFLYPWLLYRHCKKVAVKSIQDIERILYVDKDPKTYLKTYQSMIENPKSKDRRWNLKKYHNVMVAALVLNEEKLFDKYWTESDKNFDDIYQLIPLFKYFREVLVAMYHLTFNNQLRKKQMISSFELLDHDVQMSILQNPNSFHNWVISTEGERENTKEEYPYVLKQLMINKDSNKD